MKKAFILGALILCGPGAGFSQTAERTLSFSEIWGLVGRHSPELHAAEYELKAARIAENRAANHWFPRLYVDVRAYETDDPALSFMSVLEERQINSGDFAPFSLNQPQDRLYERGTLGMDLPLFEGGAKVAMAEASGKAREAKQAERDAASTAQYAQLAGSYGALLVLADEQENLAQLSDQVEGILKSYSIGSRSNPVGYSGLLGLKTLGNRLSGLQAQASAQQRTLKNQIGIQASLTGDWTLVAERAKDFLAQVLPPPSQAQEPAFVRAAQRSAESMEKLQGVENARFFPKVALFGEGTLNGGDRSSAAGYVAGAYLKWDLLDAPNFGAEEQAADSAQAAYSRAESLRKKAQTDKVRAQENLEALKANLDLMDDSSRLLEEQTDTAKNLFKNGSINALQLVEVLARRTDLITSRAQAEMDLVQAQVSLALNSGFQEPAHDNP